MQLNKPVQYILWLRFTAFTLSISGTGLLDRPVLASNVHRKSYAGIVLVPESITAVTLSIFGTGLLDRPMLASNVHRKRHADIVLVPESIKPQSLQDITTARLSRQGGWSRFATYRTAGITDSQLQLWQDLCRQ